MSMRGWGFGAAAAAGVVLARIGPVYADAPVGLSPAAEAQQLFHDGLDAANAKKWLRARILLLAAWQTQRHWRIALNLGRVEQKLGRSRDAAEHLTIGLRDAPADKLDGAERSEVEKLLADVKPRVGSLMINAGPAGAEVKLDGIVVAVAPVEGPLFVEPGVRSVTVSKEGYPSATGMVMIDPGREMKVDRVLTPPVVAAPVAIAPPPERRSPAWRAFLVGGAGAASAISLSLGVGLTLQSNHASDEAARCKLTPSCSPDRYEGLRVAYGNGAFLSLGASALLATTTLIWGLSWYLPERPRVGLTFHPSPGGASLRGSF